MDARAISDQIERILHSQTFAKKAQLRRLLEILSRSMDSDIRLKPDQVIQDLWPTETKTKRSTDVATEMNRLRHALKTYYEGEGASDTILICLPNRAAIAGNGTHERPWIEARRHGEADVFERATSLRSEAQLARSLPSAPPRLHLFFAIGAVIIVLAVLAVLFRPTLPPPRITGSTHVTHDGRDKERLVTDGPRVYYSSYPNVNPRIFQVSANGGDTVAFDTSIPGPYIFDMSPDRSELLVGSCYWGRTTSECPFGYCPF